MMLSRCAPAWRLVPFRAIVRNAGRLLRDFVDPAHSFIRMLRCLFRTAIGLGFVLFVPAVIADTLVLTTGERLSGKVISEEDATVVFESEALGKVTVAREKVATIEKTVPKEAPAPAVMAAESGEEAPKVEDRTASDLPQDKAKPALPSAPPETKREDLLRLWVDQGLRYQIAQPIRIPSPLFNGEEIVRQEVKVTGRVGIRASFDAAVFDTSRGLAPIPGDAAVRALRIYTTGNWSPTTSYSVQFGSIDKNFYLHNAYIRWTDVKWFHNVNFGYMTVPQTLENVAPFGGTTFMEPALPVLAFAPGNRMGVTADRRLWDGRGSLTYGVYSVGADPGLNFGDTTQSLLRPTVRLTGLPQYDEGKGGRANLLHLGMSVSVNFAKASTVQYRARPETFLSPFLVDTGSIDADLSAFVGGELLWIKGPVVVQAEGVLNRVERENSRPYNFGGAYVSASWMLTGEQPEYNRGIGVPERIIPIKDQSLKNGTWGAWQLAGRLSHLDLAFGAVDGGRITEATLGLNWWWNRYLRWQLNYGYAIIEGGLTPGHLQILQTRMQLMY